MEVNVPMVLETILHKDKVKDKVTEMKYHINNKTIDFIDQNNSIIRFYLRELNLTITMDANDPSNEIHYIDNYFLEDQLLLTVEL